MHILYRSKHTQVQNEKWARARSRKEERRRDQGEIGAAEKKGGKKNRGREAGGGDREQQAI
jgi:hypothetical protein